jgi:hypothetical protein
MSSKRRLDDWLTSYLRYTENSESPVSFHLWGGVSAIAAALQRRVYIKWGHSTIYPNQYIVLVGPSGQSRKAEAITIARKLAEGIKIPLIGEDNSVESVIREISDSLSNFVDQSNKKLTFQCAVSCFAEELSVFTGQQNTQFLAYLTNWYDSRDTWKRSTKHQGIDEINGMCFNLCAATAPDWIPYIFPREAIGGGFTSRCVFVVEQRKSKVVWNPNDIAPPKELEKDLKHDLDVISTISGKYEFSAKTLLLYKDWYLSEEEKIAKGNPSISDPMFSGYLARRPSHLFKLCMALTASRTNEREIGEKDFHRALKMLTMAEQKMTKVFTGIGSARYIEQTEMILNHLQATGRATKSELLNRYMRNLDAVSLDAAITVLADMKVIKVIIQPGKETIYEYTAARGPATIQ